MYEVFFAINIPCRKTQHINDMTDISALFKEFAGDVPEDCLEAELDGELG